MKKILSKKVAAAILAGTLALSPLASAVSPTMALAATGSITISNKQGQTTNYKAYQIFKADVVDDSTNATGKKETNIIWAGSDATAQAKVQKAVEDYIKTFDTDDSKYTGTTATEAATWLTNHISTDAATDLANGTYTDATVNSASVAKGLAQALVDAGLTSTSVTGGAAANLEAGYWLFVSDEDTVQNSDEVSQDPSYKEVAGESGTAPIFAVVGGSAVTVKEKTSPVTLDKVVSESGSNFVHAVDAQIGKTLSYQLRSTLPADYSSFGSYVYNFTDEMSAGLTADLDSVVVTIYNKAADFNTTTGVANEGASGTVVAPSSYEKNIDGHNILTVKIADLKKVKDADGNVIPTTKDSLVVVSYTAKLNENAVVYKNYADANNPNTAKLTYSNNPHSNGTGTTQPVEDQVFTYGLVLYKLDATTASHSPLSGVKFTIKLINAEGDDQDGDVPANYDPSTNPLYVKDDGSLSTTAYEFMTDDDGAISVKGLDKGTYEIAEVNAPTGYNPISAFQVTINRDIDATNETVSNYSTTISNNANGDLVIVGQDLGNEAGKLSDGSSSSTSAAKSGPRRADARISTYSVVSVGNVKNPNLPLTGQQGITMALIGGGTLVVVGLVASRRMNREDA